MSIADTEAGNFDMRLEVVVIPVSDVDRAKEFYANLGWRLDADVVAGDEYRLIQFTPRGSSCSLQFGKNISAAAPGSVQDLYLSVIDLKAARDELVGRGVEVSEVFHCESGFACRFSDTDTGHHAAGPAANHASYGSFASFQDPDGNGWLLQEITTRLPGR